MMIIYAVLLFGLIVFVHELGHFIFARIFDVKVLVFSLGFGKAIFKYKKGETEYKICIVPLGGYVKMLGETTQDEEIAPEDIYRTFQEKKWWQKNLIIIAGPLANLIFAIPVYFIVSLYSHTAEASVIEYLTTGSPAEKAGIHEGDSIVSINNTSVFVWEDIQTGMPSPTNGECLPIILKLKRFPDSRLDEVKVLPEKKGYSDLLGDHVEKCVIGIAALPKDTRIGLAGKSEKLKSGDKILKADDKNITRYYELIYYMEKGAKKLSVQRDDKTTDVIIEETERQQLLPILRHGGMLISSVDKHSVSSDIGINELDYIEKVNGKAVTGPFEFVSELKSLQEGADIKLDVYRDGELINKSFKLSKEIKDNKYTGMKDTTVKWGGKFYFDYSVESQKAQRSSPFLYSVKYSLEETWDMSVLTYKGLYYLITGKLSAKSLGGPIMVFDISKKAAEHGVKVFLSVMAMISINLGLINLLPIPVLDGGHILMYTLEGVRRKKIDRKVREVATMAGFIFLMLVMAFAVFNDVNRYFSLFLGQ